MVSSRVSWTQKKRCLTPRSCSFEHNTQKLLHSHLTRQRGEKRLTGSETERDIGKWKLFCMRIIALPGQCGKCCTAQGPRAGVSQPSSLKTGSCHDQLFCSKQNIFSAPLIALRAARKEERKHTHSSSTPWLGWVIIPVAAHTHSLTRTAFPVPAAVKTRHCILV